MSVGVGGREADRSMHNHMYHDEDFLKQAVHIQNVISSSEDLNRMFNNVPMHVHVFIEHFCISHNPIQSDYGFFTNDSFRSCIKFYFMDSIGLDWFRNELIMKTVEVSKFVNQL